MPLFTINHDQPPGIRLLECVWRRKLSFKTYQAIVLVITFFSYASYHAARKTTSIVKNVLDPQTSQTDAEQIFFWGAVYPYSPSKTRILLSVHEGWSPFNRRHGTALLGELDLAFLFIYATGMFLSGHLADRMDLRIFLTTGMIGTGLFTALFGLGYWVDIHNFYYYLLVQMLAGLLQSTGWPSVVAVVGNWFGKRKRGLVMGIWNAHTSVGNISGSLIAAAMLRYGWGWSFVVPALVITLVGLMVFLFLPVHPMYAGIDLRHVEPHFLTKNGNDKVNLIPDSVSIDKHAVTFAEAWKIPGVATFAFCLFFAKLVAYTFLYWLPYYISHTAIDGKYLSSGAAGNLSTLFDVGGVVGGILAGSISDRLNARAITASIFMYCAIPALFFYHGYGHTSLSMNMALMFITGMFVNGPYALITTAVSADLGTHSSLKGNSRALATVTAIIDGTGSVGAAIGPLLTGYISTKSWHAVFIMLMLAALVAGLLLARLVVAEVAEKVRSRSFENLSAVEP